MKSVLRRFCSVSTEGESGVDLWQSQAVSIPGFLATNQFDSHPVAAADCAKDLTATASSSKMSKTVYSLVICIRS